MKVLLHKPTPAIASCELTFIERNPINFEKACNQHNKYADTIRSLGAEVSIVNVNSSEPDAVFVEDVAIVLDEVAVITSMGSASRRNEISAMAKEISRFREVTKISLPATIEGGDVLRVGRAVYVGESSRTNAAGIAALRLIAEPLGYAVHSVKVLGCLHLKTGITALDQNTFIANPQWIDLAPLKGVRIIEVDPSEPWAANTLPVGDSLILNTAYPRTADKIEALGYQSSRVDISEFGKAEAGLTCMSLFFRGPRN